MEIVIVGGFGGTNIGSAFKNSALELALVPHFLNHCSAYTAPRILRLYNWHFRGRYPSNLKSFSRLVSQVCSIHSPKILLTTGVAPIEAETLKSLEHVIKVNFLTDDPWNSAHYAPWFFQSLLHYDIIFSPRRGNLGDLKRQGCSRVEYLPFGFDPQQFYPDRLTNLEKLENRADIVFAGGADRDRIPYISTLIKAGFSVDLYGSYWERYPETKHITKGQADVPTLRRAIQNAKIALCIVRHANRDGHCMRTFEVPAIGTCMLTEDTQEHREIFGPEGEAVVYFKTLSEMVEKAHWLLTHEIERQRLAQAAHRLITQGGHTYADRLKTILSLANQS